MQKYIIIFLSIITLFSCNKRDFITYEYTKNNSPIIKKTRIYNEEKRNVMLLYVAGFNTLSEYQINNISDIKKGYIPTNNRNDNVLLIFSKLPKNAGNYTTQTSPVLTRVYKNNNNQVKCDTILTLPKGTIAASAQTVNFVLKYIHKYFPAKSYGVIMSSHSTGWLPKGYYSRREVSPAPKENLEPLLNNAPKISLSTITQEEAANKVSYEINIQDFANAIPMKLDYMVMDVCLVGGIECAYSLRNKVKYLCFSQAEILAAGMPYTKISQDLIGGENPDPKQVCIDYFNYYNNQKNELRSATISMIDCYKLDTIKDVCAKLFKKYRIAIDNLNANNIQGYFRFRQHWFYDLKDILVKAQITPEEEKELDNAINQCVIYKANTPSFLNSFTITNFCGLSMYLPSMGNNYLDTFYKTLSWNKDTELVD